MRLLPSLASLAAASFIALVLSACGDDAKVGTKGAPGSGPAAAPGSAPTPAPGVPGPGSASPTAPGATGKTPDAPTAQVGDWAAWEVRVTGSELVTQLIWRAFAVDGLRVRFEIVSNTVDPKGAVVAHVETEETRSAADGPLPSGTPETLAVAGHDLATIRTEATEGTVWRSREVPLGGLVRSKAPGGVEQVLVGYGRGGNPSSGK